MCVRISAYASVYRPPILIVAFELICTEVQLKVRVTRLLGGDFISVEHLQDSAGQGRGPSFLDYAFAEKGWAR